MAASRSAAIGTEDVKVHREAPDGRTVRRSLLGAAQTPLSLGAALRVGNQAHNRQLGHCRRVYFIIIRHSTSTVICERRSISDVSEREPHCLARCV